MITKDFVKEMHDYFWDEITVKNNFMNPDPSVIKTVDDLREYRKLRDKLDNLKKKRMASKGIPEYLSYSEPNQVKFIDVMTLDEIKNIMGRFFNPKKYQSPQEIREIKFWLPPRKIVNSENNAS